MKTYGLSGSAADTDLNPQYTIQYWYLPIDAYSGSKSLHFLRLRLRAE